MKIDFVDLKRRSQHHPLRNDK